jgi:hypothetical protein
MKHYQVYSRSVLDWGGTNYRLARDPDSIQKVLGIQGDPVGFQDLSVGADGACWCPTTPQNAETLQARLPWLYPVPLGMQTSAGFGDRLGLATPGHVRSASQFGIAPIFAQQSVRENARTGRTPREVITDAVWGVFQAGYRGQWGADADHLKTRQDIEAFVNAGYTFFTFDPGAHVDQAAEYDPPGILQEKVRQLPWESLQSSPEALYRQYLDRTISIEGIELLFDEEHLLRAAAKIGRGIAHVAAMYYSLSQTAAGRPFEVEVSVDETDTPTSIHEHAFIALELRRLGVQWTSLAPRFVGRFEKGVDYIGDLKAFETQVAGHAAVARALGPYKLSLHSGSDKYSIYPIAQEAARGAIHLKTAGTSYLEALRVAAGSDPAFFREVLEFSRARYDVDRASYHVSAQPELAPRAETLTDSALPALLDNFHIRQVLHVTFGSVLDYYRPRLVAILANQEETYYKTLESHFARHLAPFSRREV